MSCPGGGGSKSSSGSIVTQFEVLNAHAQGDVQSLGSVPYKCVRPSQRRFVASEARLRYEVPDLPPSRSRRSNYYVQLLVAMKAVKEYENPYRSFTEFVSRYEYFRLDSGVSAMSDGQGAHAEYESYCRQSVSVIGFLSLVKIRMKSGEQDYPDFMSSGGFIRQESGFSHPQDNLGEVNWSGVEAVSGPIEGFSGKYMWDASASHCHELLLLPPAPPTPIKTPMPPDGGGGVPTGGDAEPPWYMYVGERQGAVSPLTATRIGMRAVGERAGMSPAEPMGFSMPGREAASRTVLSFEFRDVIPTTWEQWGHGLSGLSAFPPRWAPIDSRELASRRLPEARGSSGWERAAISQVRRTGDPCDGRC